MQLNHMNHKSQNIGNSIKSYFISNLAKLQVAKLQVILVTKNAYIIVAFNVYIVNSYE